MEDKIDKVKQCIYDEFGSYPIITKLQGGNKADIHIKVSYTETRKRRGYFKVPNYGMMDAKLLKEIQRDVAILEATWQFDHIMFLGEGDMFDYVEEGEVVPEYEVRIIRNYPDTTDNKGNYTRGVKPITDIEFWRK